MSKCSKCGNELLTGDTHWELGWCNNCYNELYKDDKTYISLDKIRLNIAQQFRDENEKLQDKVADLEAKLVESESKRKSLEEKIKFLTEETEANFVDGQKYNQLKHQLAITEKALELACERVKYFEEMQDKEMGFYEFFGYDSDYDLKAIIEQYKQQAKEMLENE